MIASYDIATLEPYVNWAYFFYAWGVKPRQPEAAALQAEAQRLLRHLSLQGVCARAVCRLLPAYSEGDDVVVDAAHDLIADAGCAEPSDACARPSDGLVGADFAAPRRLAFLRQQHAESGRPCLCLADFIAPRGYADAAHVADRIGLFATTVCTDTLTCPYCTPNLRLAPAKTTDPLLLQTVLDRLAEAAAELLHLHVRRTLWGYAPDEALSISDLHAERFQGIRPAVGYPSLPDQSLIFDIAGVLSLADIGVALTESGMMQPHASVCGLMLGHPAATYFDVGRVADDQLADYAARRRMSPAELRRFLPA